MAPLSWADATDDSAFLQGLLEGKTTGGILGEYHPCSVKILEFQMVEQALKDEIKSAKRDLAEAKKELEESRAKRHRST